jgi:hypothetical protein
VPDPVTKVFRKKNDAYYITLLVYVIFAVLYILITGTVTKDTVEFGFRDPIVYVIGIFIFYTTIMLLTNIVRNPRLLITEDSILLQTRDRVRTIHISQIREILLKRERRRVNEGTFTIVKLRIVNRRRRIRIRLATYERENELYQEFKQLKGKLKK